MASVDDIGSAFRIGAGVTHARIEDIRGRLAGGGIVATVMSNLGLERYLQSLDLGFAKSTRHAGILEHPGGFVPCERKTCLFMA